MYWIHCDPTLLLTDSKLLVFNYINVIIWHIVFKWLINVKNEIKKHAWLDHFYFNCADSKLKAKQAVNKRRNCEEDEKASVKRPKIDVTSDLSESSDSENTHKSNVHVSCSSSSSLSFSSSSSSSSSEPNSENEQKTRRRNTKLNIFKKENEKPLRLQSTNISDSTSVVDRLSRLVDFQATEQNMKAVNEMGEIITKEELVAITQITQLPQQQIPLMCDSFQDSAIGKSIVKGIMSQATTKMF